MDLSAVRGETFDEVAWVSGVLAARPPDERLESYLGTVLAKVNFAIQELAGDVGATADDAVARIPKLQKNLRLLKREAQVCDQKLQHVDEKREEVSAGLAPFLERVLPLLVQTQQTEELLRKLENVSSMQCLLDTARQQCKAGEWRGCCEALAEIGATVVRLSPAEQAQWAPQISSVTQQCLPLVVPPVVEAARTRDALVLRDLCALFDRCGLAPPVLEALQRDQASAVRSLFEKCMSAGDDSVTALHAFWEKLLQFAVELGDWLKPVLPIAARHMLVVRALTFGMEDLYVPLRAVLLPQATRTLASLFSGMNGLCVAVQQSFDDVEPAAMTRLLLACSRPLISSPAAVLADLRSSLRAGMVFSVPKTHPVALYEAVTAVVDNAARCVDDVVAVADELTQGWMCVDIHEAVDESLRSLFSLVTSEVQKLARAMDAGLRDMWREQRKVDALTDWPRFQNCVRVVQAVGLLCARLLRAADSLSQRYPVWRERFFGEQREASSDADRFRMSRVRLESDPVYRERVRIMLEAVQHESSNAHLPKASLAAGNLRQVARDMLFDTLVLPLTLVVDKYAREPSWTTTDDVPSFALLPSTCVTQVGETLLSIPQQLDPLGEALTADSADVLMPGGDAGAPVMDSHSVVSVWIRRVCAGVCQAVAQQVVDIGADLTTGGVKQLACDLDYVETITRALGQNLSSDVQLLRFAAKGDSNSVSQLRGAASANVATFAEKRILQVALRLA